MILLIVESPSKAKTINQYLGKDHVVLASYGHLRGLPSEKGSVLPEENFAMRFEILEKSKNNIDNIVKQYKNCSELLLATDQDREGEAISWHLVETLKERKVFNPKIPVKRIVFNEITKTAILKAIANPRQIDQSLVAAQQARQALDYLVGFTLSPVLWRKLPGSRSAGRVQSVALKIIAERQNEIEKFVSQEYWSVEADFMTKNQEKMTAKLWQHNGAKLEKFTIISEAQAKEVVQDLEKSSYKVLAIDKKELNRQPPPPFTTSTMLQEAAKKLGFGAKKTSKIAQDLYEGIEIQGKTKGLITYMRTDSIYISAEALQAGREVILSNYGKDYLPAKARVFKNKTKNTQEAHEAIRPTAMDLSPDQLKTNLSLDHWRLYSLIWRRTIASQMSNAVMDSVTITIANDAKDNIFKVTGTTIKFDGFLKLYLKDKQGKDDENLLPLVKIDDALKTEAINPLQHFTEAAPKFTEASLIKKLEELGIGRPSTYPSIIAVLQDRGYVQVEQKRFSALAKGRIVNAFLTSFFEKYVEYDFTATLEDQLDDISNGTIDSKVVLNNFWGPFKGRIDEVMLIKNPDILDEMEGKLTSYLFGSDEGHKCTLCDSGEMKLKTGKFGPFLGCSNYPDCKNIQKINDPTAAAGAEESRDAAGASGGSADQLELPHVIGSSDSGATYTIKRGPYGVYLEAVKGKDIKRVSIAPTKDLLSIDLNYAIELTLLPRVIGELEGTGAVKAGFGRFGPYIEFGGKYVSIKGLDPITITLEEAAQLIEQKKNEPPKAPSARKSYPPKKKFVSKAKKPAKAKK